MILSSYLFRRVTIAGVGLMGGSLGKALKKNKIAKEVIGLSHKQSSIVQAINNGSIDNGFTDIGKAVRNSDLVILATPVDSIIKLLSAINPHLKRGCIVTDVGSAKAEIVEAAGKILSSPNFFVGSHPLVGSEKKGVENVIDDLFLETTAIITPVGITHKAAQDKVQKMWTKIGATVFTMSPDEHDETLANISHLPHLLAFALMESIPEKYLEYAPKGLQDTTRIAASSPQMWNDICLANSKNVIHSLDRLIGTLAEIRKVITKRDDKALTNHFSKAKEKRDYLDLPLDQRKQKIIEAQEAQKTEQKLQQRPKRQHRSSRSYKNRSNRSQNSQNPQNSQNSQNSQDSQRTSDSQGQQNQQAPNSQETKSNE